MTSPLRIGVIGPVAGSVPPRGARSVELLTSLLTEGLVQRGHRVTLFATGDSRTNARLLSLFPQGYGDDTTLWPWELCEMMNVAAAVERANDFDLLHFQAMYYPISLPFTRLSGVPLLQTLHHAPSASEVKLWSHYPEAPFTAISKEQARLLTGVNIVGVVMHGIDMNSFGFCPRPKDYLVFLGRFTEGKGVLQAIEVARRSGLKLLMAAPENDYYREHVAPDVDGEQIVYVGEVDHAQKVALLGGARALIYPVQAGEPFGLVLPEAMACGTPIAALNRGAVAEVVDEGATGYLYETLDDLVSGLPSVMALDRRNVRDAAVRRFSAERMVDEYVEVYRRLVGKS